MRDLHPLCTDENGNQFVPCHQSSRLSAVRPFGGKALPSRSAIRAQASLLLFVLTSVVACYKGWASSKRTAEDSETGL
jgi:hypothetical protein